MKLLIMTLCAGIALAQTPDTISLWENHAPGALGDTDADRPTLTIFHAAGRQTGGTAVIVAPGGGYVNLAIDKEGRQIASRASPSSGVIRRASRERENTANVSFQHKRGHNCAFRKHRSVLPGVAAGESSGGNACL